MDHTATYFSSTTGEYIGSASAPSVESLELNTPQGATMVLGLYDETHYLDGDEAKPKGEPPALGYVFSYQSKTWVPNSETAHMLVRIKRNRLLEESDWTQLPDVPLETKAAWATYRQALRDVTDQPDIFNVVWPTPPG
jgi:Phage tail assembly chaperone protein